MQKYEWADFYHDLAEKLLAYKNRRSELAQIVYQIYENTGLHMPKMFSGPLVDIDPLTFFGIFNRQTMKMENRKRIMEQMKEIFHLAAPVPETIDGVPFINNRNATYYPYESVEAQSKQVTVLWNFFEAALAFAKDRSSENEEKLAELFDQSIDFSGIGLAKLTIPLFWWDPYLYVSLDSLTIEYIASSPAFAKVRDEIPDASQITKIKDWKSYYAIDQTLLRLTHSGEIPAHDLVELSNDAWEYNLSKVQSAKPASDELEKNYWVFAPGENGKEWDKSLKQGTMAIGWSELGNLSQYSSPEDVRQKLQELNHSDSNFMNAVRAVWDFVEVMKPGDIIFARKGKKQVLGMGVVESGYEYKPEFGEYPNIRKVRWVSTKEMESTFNLPIKTLTIIKEGKPGYEYLEQFLDFYQSNSDAAPVPDQPEPAPTVPGYSKEDFLQEVYMDEEDYSLITRFLKRKYNLILQGPPGTGKTFCSKRLAYSIMGEKASDRVEVIQFHQSTSYEDFMMGYRPSQNGFELAFGPFYTFCQKARNDPDHEYFFVIDEINRGNLSRIFGELFMLIEADKRGQPIRLLYSDESFSVPENLYLIGTMNTADRSLALMDYALRRRFGFYTMKPALEQAGFREYQKELNSPLFDRLIDAVVQLNDAIRKDSGLGPGFCIGQSFFCNLHNPTSEDLKEIVEFELIPLLQEYWYDSASILDRWSKQLLDVFS